MRPRVLEINFQHIYSGSIVQIAPRKDPQRLVFSSDLQEEQHRLRKIVAPNASILLHGTLEIAMEWQVYGILPASAEKSMGQRSEPLLLSSNAC
jgi:hypothetical protein